MTFTTKSINCTLPNVYVSYKVLFVSHIMSTLSLATCIYKKPNRVADYQYTTLICVNYSCEMWWICAGTITWLCVCLGSTSGCYCHLRKEPLWEYHSNHHSHVVLCLFHSGSVRLSLQHSQFPQKGYLRCQWQLSHSVEIEVHTPASTYSVFIDPCWSVMWYCL